MIQDAGYKMQDTRCRIQDAGYKMQDTRCRIQDAGYKMQDTRCRIQDARYPESSNPIKMANINLYLPILIRLEGGFVNDPADRGGATNMGITLNTWKSMGYDKDGDGDIDEHDLRKITYEDVKGILKKYYWDRWKADDILNQKVANMLVDWTWCSGNWGIIIPQRILGVTADSLAGAATISAVNKNNPSKLLISLYNARMAFIRELVRKHPEQVRFEQGWTKRITEFI